MACTNAERVRMHWGHGLHTERGWACTPRVAHDGAALSCPSRRSVRRERDMAALEAQAAAAEGQLRGRLRECAALSREVQRALEAWSQHSAALEGDIRALAAHLGHGPWRRGAGATAGAGEGAGAGAEAGAGGTAESAWQELEALAEARRGLRELIAESEGEVSRGMRQQRATMGARAPWVRTPALQRRLG